MRIVNLHYEDTVETDVYRALGTRINLFETVVGPLQPILAQLPRTIGRAVLSRSQGEAGQRKNIADSITQQVDQSESEGFDIDAVLDDEFVMPDRPPPAMTLHDLNRVMTREDLMPPATQVQAVGPRDYALSRPGMTKLIRVTTDPEHYEEHADSVELWSPGSPMFEAPEVLESTTEVAPATTLGNLLDQ